MSDSHSHHRSSSNLPKAKLRKGRLNWLLWLVPVAALLLCAWYVYSSILSKGPTITIYFDQIEELQADSSPMRYRGAKIGTVTSVELTPDSKRVKVKAQLDGSSANVARQGSIFWIVRPQVSVGAIRGLRTIVSGNYLTVRPGNGPRTNVFDGLEEPPVNAASGNPVDITLLSSDLASVQKNTPIFYRGIQVGEVLDYRLGNDAQAVRNPRAHSGAIRAAGAGQLAFLERRRRERQLRFVQRSQYQRVVSQDAHQRRHCLRHSARLWTARHKRDRFPPLQ